MTPGPRTRFHAGALMPLAYLLLRDRRFRLLDELLERDTWSWERICAHQAQRLTRLLCVARDFNPYWNEKLIRHGVNPNASDPFAELAKLPILTKDEVRRHWRIMRSTHLPDRDVIIESSGGSTGMQVNLFQSRAYRMLHAANEFRSRVWMGIHPGEPYLAVQANGRYIHGRQRLLRRIRTAVERGCIIDGLQIDENNVKSELRNVARRRPVHIFGYATPMVAIARIARTMALDWSAVRAVSTTAERLLDHDRAFLSDTYGAPVFDRYGSREVNSISMQCERGGHHIFADLNLVEFVPIEDADEDLRAIVVTPLDNEAMPLFRYRSGDEAGPVAGDCPCGRALPRMTGCRGRIANNFVTTDGRLINGGYFSRYFHRQEMIRAFQFHQTSMRHIDVFVVPEGGDSSATSALLDSMVNDIERDYPGLFEIDVHIVNDIPRRPSGKHLFTISDVLLHV